MDKSEVTYRFSKVGTPKELLALLNQIEQEEFGTQKPISVRTFFVQSDASRPERYHTFLISKKSGGTREIASPNPYLKRILRSLNIVLQAIYEPIDNVMGFVIGRSVVDNANAHLGENYVFNIDLKDFFTNISQQRVRYVLMQKHYGMNFDVANFISWLCCKKQENEKGDIEFVLPQGAPTSPVLTNMVCVKLDRKLNGLARRFGLRYTRYADDITFSSMHNVYQQDGDFQKELRIIIEEQGFTLNQKKTRLQTHSERQDVTGLTVNSKSNVSRKYIKQLRGLLNIWEKYGYNAAFARFYPRYKTNNGSLKKGEPVMENVIAGKLHYLSMVKGENDSTFRKLMDRFITLTSLPASHIAEMDDNIQYLVSYKSSDFETRFNTTIESNADSHFFKIGENVIPVIVGKYRKIEYDEGTENIFNMAGESNQTAQTAETKEEKYITLCASKGKKFWLLSEDKPSHVQGDYKDITVDRILNIWESEGTETAIKEYGKLTPTIIIDLLEDQQPDYAEQLLTTWETKGIKAAYEYYSTHKNSFN